MSPYREIGLLPLLHRYVFICEYMRPMGDKTSVKRALIVL